MDFQHLGRSTWKKCYSKMSENWQPEGKSRDLEALLSWHCTALEVGPAGNAWQSYLLAQVIFAQKCSHCLEKSRWLLLEEGLSKNRPSEFLLQDPPHQESFPRLHKDVAFQTQITKLQANLNYRKGTLLVEHRSRFLCWHQAHAPIPLNLGENHRSSASFNSSWIQSMRQSRGT